MRADSNDQAVECSADSSLTVKARNRTWFFHKWQLRLSDSLKLQYAISDARHAIICYE